MIKIYEARDSLEAHFLRNLLESADIETEVLGELLGMARGELPLTGETLPSVWVGPDDLVKARDVVHEFEQKQKERKEDLD
jgi:hypothetical protein